MDVFDSFVSEPYEFLTIVSGVQDGISARTPATGILEFAEGMNVASDQSTKETDATLLVRPQESFISTGLVGHGIAIRGRTYEITGRAEGARLDNGTIEHYEVTLQEREYEDIS